MKKKKPFLFALADRLFARVDEKTPAQEVTAHLDTVRNAFHTETAGLLAAALFAKKTLDTTRQVETPFPDAYFSGEAAIEDAARAHLAAYAVALGKFQVQLLGRDTPISAAAGRGMTTWIASCYAMSIPGMLPQGQELWAKLVQGADGLEDAHKFLVRRAPSDVERMYFDYRPKALL